MLQMICIRYVLEVAPKVVPSIGIKILENFIWTTKICEFSDILAFNRGIDIKFMK